MSSSRWALFMNRLNRSTERLRDSTGHILAMDAMVGPERAPKTLLKFHTPQDMERLAVGCDGDVGGMSSANLTFDPESPNSSGGLGTGRFLGVMKLGVKAGLEGKLRSGYAGFRSKTRPTLFSEVTDDISSHEYLSFRLRARGHPRTRNSYYVNIQTKSSVAGELWQHRLYFHRNDEDWEDICIPLSSFVLTSFGQQSSGQVSMRDERIRWLGISLLGGNSGVEGPFELGLDSIKAVNQEDVNSPISVEPSDGTRWERGPLM